MKVSNTFKFSTNDYIKFILLFRKGVYPFEYMEDWEKFNETTLAEKKKFYSNLNVEEIKDVDYMYGARVCKGLK